MQRAELHIHLHPAGASYSANSSLLNVHRGGPHTLLHWLETQLGLLFDPPAHSDRVTEYANALENNPCESFK
ncbi:MAG: hypothetical protein QF886_18930, partial [Planctomycetota bacterium]|nr:hypothetical protein [Planctomycetota bacterium]